MSPKHPYSTVRLSGPRETVQVRLPEGFYEAPFGTPLEDFIQVARPQNAISLVAALVDNMLRELTWPVTRDVDVLPVSRASGEGLRIYRRSLCFLLIVATRELYPSARIIVDHSLTLGGFFCRVTQRGPFNQTELARVEQRMQEIVAADETITHRELPWEQVKELFHSQGYEDKVNMLRFRSQDALSIHSLRGVHDHFYGYMVPSTRYLDNFTLRLYPPGFILRFPQRFDQGGLPCFRDFPGLATVFREYGQWIEVMEIDNVGSLNQTIEKCRIREVALVAEALHERRIAEIAREIASRRNQVRLVFIAGPSSSGKTTFAKRLAIQLLTRGIRPLTLSLDDYFLSREDTPRDVRGEYDYESLGALDVELLSDQLCDLLAGREVTFPQYDFISGRRKSGPTLAISPERILLVEGIHGLNPDLVSSSQRGGTIPEECVYRIYVSALTQLNLDCHNRIATTDTRLLRRIVRDARERGISAEQNICRWDQVVCGEFQNIFPYQENADVMFNSALVYELGVMKSYAEPLLHQVNSGSVGYVEASRLLAFLDWFLHCDAEIVPGNSILREFIGSSGLEGFGL